MFKAISIFLASSMLVASCSVAPILSSLREDEGIIVFQNIVDSRNFIHRSQYGNTLKGYTFGGLEIEKTDEPNRKFNYFATYGYPSNQVIYKKLPEGEYTIKAIQVSTHGTIYQRKANYVTYYPLIPHGRFRVESKKITNLGSLVFYIDNLNEIPIESPIPTNMNFNPVGKGKYRSKLFVDPQPIVATESYIKTYFPNTANKLDFEHMLGWESLDTQFETKLKNQALQNAYGNASTYLPKHNVEIIFTKYNSVKWRHPDDSVWSIRKFPTNRDILTAIEVDNKILFAGSRGQTFLVTDMKSRIEEIHPLDGNNDVIWLGTHDNKYYALAKKWTESKTRIEVYQIDNLDSWTLLGEFKIYANAYIPSAFITPSGTINLADWKNVYEYDNSSGRWKTRLEDKLGNVIQLPNGTLVGLGYNKSVDKAMPTFSIDHGVNWKFINKQHLPDTFELFQNQIAIKHNKIFMLGQLINENSHKIMYRDEEIFQNIRLLKLETDDDLNVVNSELLPRPPLHCFQLLAGVSSNNNIYISCDNGKIIASEDDGKSWILTKFSNTIDK